jgi:putative ABC transport system substrate-binding protein
MPCGFEPHRKVLLELAVKHGLGYLSGSRDTTVAGGLVSISANFQELYERSAVYVDKILRGAKPADLPVSQPTKFVTVINLKTASALGMTISPVLVAQADEVIE